MAYTVPTGAANTVIGGMSEAEINAQNQYMRDQPWYRAFLASLGQDPMNVRLSEPQRDALLRLAQANGFVVDQGAIEVDPAGNFNPKGHKLRNTLLAAGIGGAALTGLGAAGVGPMSGLFGGGVAAGTGPALLAGAPTGAALPGVLPSLGAAGAASGAAAAGGAAATAPAWLSKVIRAAVPVAGVVAGQALRGPAAGGTGVSSVTPPELQQLLSQAMRRMADQDGLFQSVTAQAKAGLPTAYQR